LLGFAKLHGADLSGAVWTNVNAVRADFTMTILCRTVFREVSFAKAKLVSADLTRCGLTFAKNLTLEQILSSENYDNASLSPELAKELEKLKTILPDTNADADADSSENRAGE
jgi:uncharacterized protein YjbI with pentapeptide repeats